MKSLPSGRFVVRLPPVLHRALRSLAFEQGISMNELCVKQLQAALTQPHKEAQQPTTAAVSLVSSELIQLIVANWSREVVAIYLYGSAARGDFVPTQSDIDLLIILNPESKLSRALYRRWDLLLADNPMVMTEQISPQFTLLPKTLESVGALWMEVALDGIPLYDPHLSVARILSMIRRSVAEGKLIRKIMHGHPYWIREAA